MSTIISFRADDDTVATLDKLCAATERERTYHLGRALTRYLESEMWHIKAVQEGIDDVNAGRTTPLEEVAEQWRRKRDDRIEQAD